MALINTLTDIGNAIREKTGGTELIPLKEMASAISGISSVPNPLEYAIKLDYLFQMVAFPENYELVIDVPNMTAAPYLLFNATGLKKLTIKGNANGNAVNFAHAIRQNAALEVIDLSEFNAKFSNATYTFMGDKKLKEIKGVIDLTECTTVTTMFNGCYVLVDVRFKEFSIKLSINFADNKNLSAESVQSIIDGLATVETAQTLTLHSSIVLTDEQKAQISSKNWTLVQ